MIKLILALALLALNCSAQFGPGLGFFKQNVIPSTTSLLLDSGTTVNAASVKGAYSVARKLRTAYSGNAFVVRRSSDDATNIVHFSGNGILESDLTTFCAGTDGYVSLLYDQGSAGNNLSSSSGSQPKIVTSGVIEKDTAGKITMVFDGSDDFLAASGPTFGSQVSGFFVVNNRSFVSALKTIVQGGSTTRGVINQKVTGGNGVYVNAGTQVASSVTLSANTRYVLRAMWSTAGTDSIKVNSNAETTGEAGTNPLNQLAFGGSTTCPPINISEGVWFDVQIDDAGASEQSSLLNNINSFYAIY